MNECEHTSLKIHKYLRFFFFLSFGHIPIEYSIFFPIHRKKFPIESLKVKNLINEIFKTRVTSLFQCLFSPILATTEIPNVMGMGHVPKILGKSP